MVTRLGIGAASASAVIFSIVLLSNLALFTASGNRATLYSQADESDLLRDEAVVLTGATATNFLLETESFLSAGPLDCSTAAPQLSARVETFADVQHSGFLTVSATARVVPGTNSFDNLSIASPFAGSVAGVLTLAVSVSARSNTRVDGVAYGRSEVHLIHLPIRWESEVRDCLHAVASVSASTSYSKPSNCTASAVGPILEAAVAGPRSEAAADGFVLGVSYSIATSNPCAADFRITLEQAGAEGPGGMFNVFLVGAGTAAFA